MGNHISPARKINFSLIICLLLHICFSCRFTPLGGGDLVVSSSVAESKEKGMFKREYTFPDSVFEYKDSIINIKLVFSDIFVENTHKEMRRIPEYKEKRYYNSGCDTCPEQIVACLKIEDCELEYYDDYWYIDNAQIRLKGLLSTYAYRLNYEDFMPDIVKLQIVSGYKYNDMVGIERRIDICFDTLTFVRK